jgi:hypothetical protein
VPQPRADVKPPVVPFAGIAQDDIDSLFGGGTAATTPASPPAPAVGVAQDDIDSLLGGMGIGEPAKPSAAPAVASDGGISQSDLDSLFAESSPVAAGSPKGSGVAEISQDDLNSLFAQDTSAADSGTTVAASQPGGEEAAISEASIENLFQEEGDNMAALFEGASNGDSEQPSASAPATKSQPQQQTTPAAKVLTRTEQIGAEIAQAAAEIGEAEEARSKVAVLAVFKKIKLPKVSRKQKAAALAIAASVVLIVLGVQNYNNARKHLTAFLTKKHAVVALAPKPAEKTTEAKQEAPPASTSVAETKPVESAKPETAPVQTAKAEPTPVPQKPVEPKGEEIKAEKPISAPTVVAKVEPPVKTEPVAEPVVAQAAKPVGENTNISFGIIVPVDFNTQMVKVMTADIELTFASGKDKKSAEKKQFAFEMAIEKEIEIFFKDKFYENTHYVQDKLAAHLMERVKKRNDLGKVTAVNIDNFIVK